MQQARDDEVAGAPGGPGEVLKTRPWSRKGRRVAPGRHHNEQRQLSDAQPAVMFPISMHAFTSGNQSGWTVSGTTM